METFRVVPQEQPETFRVIDANAPKGPSEFRSGLEGFAQGATLNFSDEMEAGARALFGDNDFSTDFDESLKRVRARIEAAEKANPKSFLAGNIGGAVATAAVPGSLLLRSGATAAKALSAGQVAVRGAALGAAEGGLAGIGAGDGALDRATKGAIGASVGGAAGAVLPLAVGGVRRGVDAVRRSRAASPVSKEVGSRAGPLIADDMALSGKSVSELQQRAAELGDNSMLAELDETLAMRLEQVANSGLPAQSRARQAIQERAAGAEQRIYDAFDKGLGRSVNVAKQVKSMTKETKLRARGFYKLAEDNARPIDTTPAVRVIDDAIAEIGLPSGNKVTKELRKAKRLLVDKKGTAVGIKTLHQRQQLLRETAKQLQGRKGMGLVAGKMFEAHRALLSQMDNATRLEDGTSIYEIARNTFRDDKMVQEAFETGRDIFSNKVHPDFLAEAVEDMSRAEIDTLKVGARAAVREAAGRVRQGVTKSREILSVDFNAEKLRTILGDAEADRLIQRLEAEQVFNATTNRTVGGSPTGRRTNNNPFVPGSDEPGPVVSLLNLNAGSALHRTLDPLRRSSRNILADQAADALTATGSRRDAILAALEKSGPGQPLGREAVNNLNVALFSALQGSTQPLVKR